MAILDIKPECGAVENIRFFILVINCKPSIMIQWWNYFKTLKLTFFEQNRHVFLQHLQVWVDTASMRPRYGHDTATIRPQQIASIRNVPRVLSLRSEKTRFQRLQW